MLHKKLKQAGNSWSIDIPKSFLESLNINPILHEMSIILEGDSIKLKKYKEENDKS